MSNFLELAARVERSAACDWATSVKYAGCICVTEKERDMIVTALRGADALRALADLSQFNRHR